MTTNNYTVFPNKSTQSLSQDAYYHTFYQVSKNNPNVMTVSTYDNNKTLVESVDVSFGPYSITETLQILDQNGTNPFVVGSNHTGSSKLSMDVAYFDVFNRYLTPAQQRGVMTNTIKINTYAKYEVKTVQNVLGQTVFALKGPGETDFVSQPDLSFNAGDTFMFDVSDPTMTGYSLVFGTTVDDSSSIVTDYVTTNGSKILLDISGDYTGDALVYFEDTSAGMGYVSGDVVTYNIGDLTTESEVSTMLSNIGFNSNDYSSQYLFFDDLYNEGLTIPGRTPTSDASPNLYDSSTGQYLLPYPQFQKAIDILGWGKGVQGGIIGTFANATTLNIYYGTSTIKRTDLTLIANVYTPACILRIRDGVTTELDRTWTWSEWNNGINAWTVADRLDQIQRKVTVNVAAGDTIVVGDKALQSNVNNQYYVGQSNLYAIEKPVTAYTVTVANGVFYIDDDYQPQLTFTAGETYVFDQSDPSNTGHPLVIGTTADNLGSLVSYQTVVGTPGQPGAYTSFTATADTVYYFCYYHTGMGSIQVDYTVKTVTNVLGDDVYAFDTNGDGTFYNQPDLTFAVGSTYFFDTSQIASGYTLSFGTTIDGTPDTSVVSSPIPNILMLDLTAKTGDPYTYFDSTNAGMRYVDKPVISLSFLANSVLGGWFSEPINTYSYTLSGNSNTFANGDYQISQVEPNGSYAGRLHYLLDSGTSGYPGYDFMHDPPKYSGGNYIGTLSTTAGGTTYSGPWMQLTMPYSMVITQIDFYSRPHEAYSAGSFHIFGSNDGGTTFTHLLSPTLNYDANFQAIITFSGITTAYSTYRISTPTLLTTGGVTAQSEYLGLTGNVTAPAPTYEVTVVNGVFYIDNDYQPQFPFTAGETYVFDQSDPSNTGHPLVIGTTADNLGSLVSYQTVVGTPGQPGAYTSFTATSDTVYYFCYYHPGMGAQSN